MISENFIRIKQLAVLLGALSLAGCGGSSSDGGSETPTAVTLSGTVSAPSGTIAYNQPSVFHRLFAVLFGDRANAAISGVNAVGAGITINLIEVDATGAQVGDVIATTSTDSNGAYTLDAPSDFTLGSQYVIRAMGSSENIDARVSSTTADVDPVTDAASNLVTSTASDLTLISTTELDEILSAVDEVSQDVDASSLTAEALSSAILTEANQNEETNNAINSTVSTGQICGTVTNSSGNALANIRVVARDFGNWVTRARTRTATDGSYCLNVPKSGDADANTGGTFSGEYILGVINRIDSTLDPDFSASEWWASNGTAYNQFDAEKITVSDTTTVTNDFQLADGGRVSGTVVASDTSAALEGVKVIIRDFDSRTPIATARVKADGSYRVNVIAGTYVVVARNKTNKAYGSEAYDGASGSNNRFNATPVSVTTGGTQTIDFALEAGYKINGVVTDGTGGNAVAGQRIMVNLSSGGASERLRTNKQGKYRVWVKPDTYDIYAYGQNNLDVDLTASNQTVNFESSSVSRITATVVDANAQPISQSKVRLYDASGAFVNFELTNSDGSATVYTDQTGDHLLEVRIDSGASFATIVYNDDTRLLSGQTINVASASSTVNAGTISLPAAGILRGTVTSDGTTTISNFRVQVRDDNDLSATSGGVTGGDIFTRARTRGDGTYVMSLPAGIYDRVKMRDATGNGNCNTVTITAGETTTLNFNDGDDSCS